MSEYDDLAEIERLRQQQNIVSQALTILEEYNGTVTSYTVSPVFEPGIMPSTAIMSQMITFGTATPEILATIHANLMATYNDLNVQLTALGVTGVPPDHVRHVACEGWRETSMTDFVVTITDPEQLAGITWAREQYNASLPPPPPLMPMPLPAMPAVIREDDAEVQVEDERSEDERSEDERSEDERSEDERSEDEILPQIQPEGTLNTDEEYVQWVMESAAASYAVQQEQATWRQAYEDAQAETRAKRMRSG